MDAVMQAARISGVRARLARGCGDCAPYFDRFLEPLDVIVAETRRLVEKSDARVRVEFGPMITWGCTADALKTMDRLAREWNVGMHIHINETRAEVQMSLEATGMRQINWLDSLGVLNERWQLVHCVWLDESEIQIVAERGCTVVHCPVSNMYLASGIAPIVEYRRRRIPVALASDGPGSNNSQDMLEVLKTTANLQKVGTLDAMSLLPEDVLDMCYRGGATALGLGDQIGRLAPGALADLVLVDLERAHIAPVHSPQSALVYNANGNDVDTVVVNGEVVVRGGELVKLSEKGLVRDCQRAAEAMARRAGIRR
jgi:5-methylthioadenosine/S-adenosylhomocysteine deaminase